MKSLLFMFFIFFSVSAQTPELRLLLQNENMFDSKLASGGSITSVGGGDTADLSQLSAWFYNNGEIKTCMALNKNFGIDKREIEIQITAAIRAWKNYFNENKINNFIKENISTNFNFKSECLGNEDLVLYFGTGPISDNLLDVKAFQKLNKPIAYANKTHISEDMTWSKGYIRFMEQSRYHKETRQDPSYPDWNIKDSLYQFILHELGHVLGFEHKPGTIMDENISYDLFISKTFSALSIDAKEDLFETKSKVKEYKILEILNNDAFNSVFNNKIPSFLISNKSDGSIELEINFQKKNSEFYLSTTVINTPENIPLYTNFQEERSSFLKTQAAYFKINSHTLSFSFNGDQNLIIINGEPSALYKEEI